VAILKTRRLELEPSWETSLEFGEWTLQVSVTSANEDDSASSVYSLQLNPDLSSGWTPTAAGRQ
jgi:hypothetical protein